MADPRRTPDAPEPDDRATEELVAYLDGELDPQAAEAVVAKLGRDPALRAQADSLQRAWDALDLLPRPEPSAAFTSRTLSQVMPAAAGSGQTAFLPGGPAVATMPAMSSPRPGAGFWLASAALVLAAGFGGYVAHWALARPTGPPLEDVPLMKNMRLYRHVDDMDYLKHLESPELFGDEAE